MNNILSDTTLSDSDCYNSDIEFELYSQLHYRNSDGPTTFSNVGGKFSPSQPITIRCQSISTSEDKALLNLKNCINVDSAEDLTCVNRKRNFSDCSNDVEDWEIIKSDNNSDGGTSCSSDSDKWKVSLNDIHRSDKRILRYYRQAQIVCNYCSKEGHKAFKCPKKTRKKRRCYFCGEFNHLFFQCDLAQRLDSCFDRKYKCKRCGQIGHQKEECPDLWRQYHMTVNTKRLIMPKQVHVPKHKRMCHNCCNSGHWAHECEEGCSNGVPRINPTVTSYCLNGKIKRKGISKSLVFGKLKKKKKRLKNNYSNDNSVPFQSFEINNLPNTNFDDKASDSPNQVSKKKVLSDNKFKKRFTPHLNKTAKPGKKHFNLSKFSKIKERNPNSENGKICKKKFSYSLSRFHNPVISSFDKKSFSIQSLSCSSNGVSHGSSAETKTYTEACSSSRFEVNNCGNKRSSKLCDGFDSSSKTKLSAKIRTNSNFSKRKK